MSRPPLRWSFHFDSGSWFGSATRQFIGASPWFDIAGEAWALAHAEVAEQNT